jgi:hypothetical protein
LTTRKAKRDIGKKLEIIQEGWREEAQQENIGKSVLATPLPIQSSMAKATQEVNSAIRHLSENSVSFSRGDIYQYSGQF